MSSTETKDIKKDEDVLAILAKVSVQNSETLKEIQSVLVKLADSNPVAHGGVLEAKPKQSDEQEIGEKVKATNDYGQSRQASIVNEGNVQSDSDKDDLSMEEHKKSAKTLRKEPDPDPDPDPDPEPDPEPTKKSSMKKAAPSGFQYVEVPAVRPQIFAKTWTQRVTGYQILDAINKGFGKHTDAEASITEAYQHLIKGEYGTGAPGELEQEW